jgi:hypothetical protein
VLVVDNWVRRNLPGMTLEQIAQKYALYWADINKFYDIHFGINLNLTYVHVEDGSSFTETLDGQELLDSFTNGLRAGVFAGVPSGACLYHLITGRNPYGVGGLAWVNAACASNFGATGFSVDGQGDDEGNSVIGFAIHVRLLHGCVRQYSWLTWSCVACAITIPGNWPQPGRQPP